MKKTLLALMATLLIGSAVADDRTIDYNTFPQSAKTFVKKHFPKTEVTSATTDDGEYTAYLSCGGEVEFRNNGELKEVKCTKYGIPSSIIPAKIATYLKANYAQEKVYKLDVDYRDYELKLSNGLELKFDLKGNFIRIDD